MSPGPQTKYSRTAGGIEQARGEAAHARGIEPAVVELDLLGLAAHDEVQRQAPEVAVLEGEQLLEAHGAAVPVLP